MQADFNLRWAHMLEGMFSHVPADMMPDTVCGSLAEICSARNKEKEIPLSV